MFEVHVPKLVKASDINPAPYNPRRITPEKFDSLKKSIEGDGFLEPLIVQKKGTRLIGGHQRLRAIKEICVEAGEATPDLPCIVLDVNDLAAKRLNIKLNKIQGEFEARMLGELLVDIYETSEVPVGSDDTALLGFMEEEAEKFIRLVDPEMVPQVPSGDEPSGFGKSITLSIEFETVALRDKVKKALTENSKVEKKKSGDLVASALGLVKKKAKKQPEQVA